LKETSESNLAGHQTNCRRFHSQTKKKPLCSQMSFLALSSRETFMPLLLLCRKKIPLSLVSSIPMCFRILYYKGEETLDQKADTHSNFFQHYTTTLLHILPASSFPFLYSFMEAERWKIAWTKEE
jgi:hypothetical protein